MDLSKAFDCVNHEILLYKLEMAGIRGQALELLRSYLTNRKMSVNFNGFVSTEKTICIGVPQGSVLLYLVYVNDMAALKLNGKLRLFADDSALFYANKLVSENDYQMRQDIRLLSDYFRINKLSLNVSKIQYVHFAHPRKKIQAVDSVSVDNVEIHRAETVKYLGLHIDSHLTWNEHVNHVSAKVATAAGMMRKLNFLLIHILRKLYFALAHSHLSYAAIVWASATDSTRNKVQELQRKALKACYKLGARYSTIELFTQFARGILPLKAVRVQQVCETVYSSLHRTSPINLIFRRNLDYHLHRRRKPLRVPTINSKFGEQGITYFGPKCYIDLPVELQITNSEMKFKSLLGRHMRCPTQITKYIR